MALITLTARELLVRLPALNVASLFILSLALSLSGCDQARKEKYEPFRMQGSAFGTTYSIIAYSQAKNASSNHRKLKSDIEQLLLDFDASLSTYHDDTEISRFNRADTEAWIPVSKRLYEAVKTANAISRITVGRYDITIGAVTQLYGFGGGREPKRAPNERELVDAKELVDYRALEYRASSASYELRKEKAVILDVSSISKGQAVDELAALIEERGIKSYLVEIGGEMRIGAAKPLSGPPAGSQRSQTTVSGSIVVPGTWTVGVEEPRHERRRLARVLALTNQSIATSGDYRNYYLLADDKTNKLGLYPHTINPQSGKPAYLTQKKAGQVLSITVLHERCMVADAWATALKLFELDDAVAIANAYDLDALFIYMKDYDSDHLKKRVSEQKAAIFAASDSSHYGYITTGTIDQFLITRNK